jgi:CTP:molybdopterin cytidylyltransferase MocA
MTKERTTTLGVLLAAGSGSRFNAPEHKLVAPLRGTPVISHSLAALTEAGLDGILVVTGAADVSQFLQGVTTVHNPLWASGQRSSVECALTFAREHSYGAVVVGLADQPFITPDCWKSVAESDAAIAVATYEGVRGNPVRLDASVWDLFSSTPGDPDSGARSLMHLHPELVREVACKGNSADIDTTEDLSKWT